MAPIALLIWRVETLSLAIASHISIIIAASSCRSISAMSSRIDSLAALIRLSAVRSGSPHLSESIFLIW